MRLLVSGTPSNGASRQNRPSPDGVQIEQLLALMVGLALKPKPSAADYRSLHMLQDTITSLLRRRTRGQQPTLPTSSAASSLANGQTDQIRASGPHDPRGAPS